MAGRMDLDGLQTTLNWLRAGRTAPIERLYMP
jgi:hypothetical protein